MSELIDDGGPQLIAVEAGDQSGASQALWVRTGPVWDGDSKRAEPGIWIGYQERYMGAPLAGPVLLDLATWRALASAVEERLSRYGYPQEGS